MLERAMIEDFCMKLERDHPGVPAVTILHHFYTLFRERQEQSAIISRLRDTLEYTRATLADHHDIEDGDGKQLPNWAMRATNVIDETLQANGLAKES